MWVPYNNLLHIHLRTEMLQQLQFVETLTRTYDI